MSQPAATEEHPLDLLQCIGNTGALKATASLSALAGRPIENSYSRVRIVPLEEVPGLLGNPEEVIAGVIFTVTGDVAGQFMVVLPLGDAARLVKTLTGTELPAGEEPGEMAMSALAEVGNILASSYLAAIERNTGLALGPSPPGVAVDMAGGILTSAVLPAHESGSEILLIEARFGRDQSHWEGRMILLPSSRSLPRLLHAVWGAGVDE